MVYGHGARMSNIQAVVEYAKGFLHLVNRTATWMTGDDHRRYSVPVPVISDDKDARVLGAALAQVVKAAERYASMAWVVTKEPPPKGYDQSKDGPWHAHRWKARAKELHENCVAAGNMLLNDLGIAERLFVEKHPWIEYREDDYDAAP